MKLPTQKLLPLLGLCLVCAGCAPFGSSQSGGSASPSPFASYNAQARPSSPATLRFVQPQDKAQLKAGVIHIELNLQGAQIVRQTSTHITSTTGHIHFSVNDKLVAMNYSAQQDTPLTPGVYRLTAEFVAADHVPFNPRVMTSIIIDVQ
jgi:methionine-rich copper-binding protein CopC